jgi:UDP-N-acetyl-alpha-D-muramoyl-L-alanyl-L-glutamate epimerase
MSVPNRFDPASVGTFRVIDRAFDSESRTVSLGYGFDDGPTFVETLTFETKPGHDGTVDAPGLERALLHLHIAAGTSYYKTAAPSQVVVEGVGLAPAEIEFHRHLYDEGLREFAVANHLPVPHRLSIRAAHASGRPAAPDSFEREGGLLVPIGGGKDSMVLIEAVKHLHPRLFAVNPHPLVIELANQTGLELLVVRRRLSPQLGVLNRSGALNGHVPITALISLIAVVGSFLYGYDAIVMAIERSASEETVVVDGVPVNHQYSKSLDFEVLVQELISGFIDPDLRYGSALRPYSELAIARAFARLTGYHATFCSCNTAFRQTAGADDGWCGDCPKCRFVGLMLAPFLTPDAVRSIVGRDMFEDPDQIPGFAALMSNDDKPFECVGERRESAAAMRILSDRPDWKDTVVVASLADRARAMVSDEDVRALLTARPGLGFARPEVADAVGQLLTVGA